MKSVFHEIMRGINKSKFRGTTQINCALDERCSFCNHVRDDIIKMYTLRRSPRSNPACMGADITYAMSARYFVEVWIPACPRIVNQACPGCNRFLSHRCTPCIDADSNPRVPRSYLCNKWHDSVCLSLRIYCLTRASFDPTDVHDACALGYYLIAPFEGTFQPPRSSFVIEGIRCAINNRHHLGQTARRRD